MLSIASVRRTVYLANAYFVPDDLSVQTIVRTLQRGVRVGILSRHAYRFGIGAPRRASRARLGELLEAGAEIFEYQPTMFHCDVWVSAGSIHFDSRPFRLNDKANLNIYGHAFTQRQIGIFEDGLKMSRQITAYAAGQDRPWSGKLLEHPWHYCDRSYDPTPSTPTLCTEDSCMTGKCPAYFCWNVTALWDRLSRAKNDPRSASASFLGSTNRPVYIGTFVKDQPCPVVIGQPAKGRAAG
ncbi:MAG TPA: hypothetical protein DEB56_04945 [Thiobacillus sp.]|nr:hypothetical protein [Thiobacillus sp.]